ncbi:MAG: hypothetical protein IPK85_10395 [Gemmatimonadetes bacterium]|nr:hypothetical protein [Gemmatimonadota bacterium]
MAALALCVGAGVGGVWMRQSLRARGAPHGHEVTVGLQYADSLERDAPTSEFSEADALAALYLERARLGMGSPFRLAEFALNDQALSEGRRRLVAGAILGRIAEGRVYTSPEEALDLLSATRNGLAHRALIEGTLDSATDIRAAELALRMAYQVAAASGATAPRAAAVALAAIAQGRDRTLAMRDVRDLLVSARRAGQDPLDVLPEWRKGRRLAVERPLVEPPGERQERAAAVLLPRLVARLQSLTSVERRTRRERAMPVRLAIPAADFATRRAGPPQAPVVVTLGGFSQYVVSSAAGIYQQARRVFVSRARTEETLVAEYNRLRAVDPKVGEASLAVLTAAVAMRPYAQERPWFPGDFGPSPDDVRVRHGLASLTFDARVAPGWRTYYAGMLDNAIGDLKLVFPRLDLGGLAVRFGPSPLRDQALALHDPRTRTVYFPIETSAGAIAHELAHDLDWQAARRRYGATASYRTDRSVRQYRDGLAAPIDRMSANGNAGRQRTPSSESRPTEVFARSVDWLVAQALAQRGVMNGYLSAAQDEWLTGYASATAPRRDTPEPDGTMAALHEIADVSRSVVGWYDRAYGSARRASLSEVVRRVLVAPLPRLETPATAFHVFASSAQLLRRGTVDRDSWACQLNAPSLRGGDAGSVRRALDVAATTRAAGVLDRWGEWSEGAQASPRLRALGGPPWNAGARREATREMRDAILWRATRPDDGRNGTSLLERLERQLVAAECARG